MLSLDKTIGRELGVRFVVEGPVRRAASRLRISARLIDANTDDHLWTEHYDGTVEDVFTMKERLARTGEVKEMAATFPAPLKDTIPERLTWFLAHALAGNRSKALAVLTPEIETIANATDVFPRFLAFGYAAAGMPDRAIHWLSVF